jgi:hypothetical protein
MFYCNDCGVIKEWPIVKVKSYGPCEQCGNLTECNDVPSIYLPRTVREPLEEFHIINTEK